MASLVSLQVPKFSPSVYFSPEYGRAEQAQTGHDWKLLSDDDGTWQIPLLIRDFKGQAVDATTPYGYGGIYADPSLSPADIAVRWTESKKVLRDLDVVSVFLRSAPFLQSPSLGELDAATLEVKRISQTFAVDVTDELSAWKALKGSVRTAVRKAESSGLVAAVDDKISNVEDSEHPFRVLYEKTMRRLAAHDQYYFTNAYFASLAEMGPNRIRLVTVRDDEGNSGAAALLFLDEQDTVHYHLSGSDPASARLGANNLLIWETLRWAANQGFKQVHLGGGVRSGDGLEKFKRSFGGRPLPFEIGTCVLDPDKYRALVASHQRGVSASNFFPAYRRGE